MIRHVWFLPVAVFLILSCAGSVEARPPYRKAMADHYGKFLSIYTEFRALTSADPTFDPARPVESNPSSRLAPDSIIPTFPADRPSSCLTGCEARIGQSRTASGGELAGVRT